MEEFICTRCDICKLNSCRPIIGDGNLDANIMFITRNPSAYEVKNNIPLYSKNRMLFQEYLDLFNLNRDLIYIANAVKCRTPGSRYPTDTELFNCREYLNKEIVEVNPKIIVLLGDTAIRSYFKLYFNVLSIHINDLNAKYIIHNNKVILFMIHPYHGLNSINIRKSIFNAFNMLLNLYRTINPTHTPNFY